MYTQGQKRPQLLTVALEIRERREERGEGVRAGVTGIRLQGHAHRSRQKPAQTYTGFTPVVSDRRTATNPAPKQGAEGGCAEEGMCSWEDSSHLCPWLVEEQKAPRSQGSPGDTRGLGLGFSYLRCCLVGIFSV